MINHSNSHLLILRKPENDFSGADISLLVTYAPNRIVPPVAKAYLNSLVDHGFTVILCVAVDHDSLVIDETGLERAKGIVVRKNSGFDFALWASVLTALPKLWEAKRILFTNDSLLGPLQSFGTMVETIRQSDASFIALTESYEKKHHTQSFFFVLQNQALNHEKIRDLWDTVQNFEDKSQVIHAYELELFGLFNSIEGMKTGILYPYDRLSAYIGRYNIKKINPTHHLWEGLVKCGFPFIKAELLARNPLRLNIDHWRDVVRENGGDIAMFEDHLRYLHETGRQPKPFTLSESYTKWRVLRKMIKDDRFFKMRAWLKARKR
jgi:Rhamnan synthesis protein F